MGWDQSYLPRVYGMAFVFVLSEILTKKSECKNQHYPGLVKQKKMFCLPNAKNDRRWQSLHMEDILI